MIRPEVITSATICIPALLLAGCNDIRVKNELKNPYNISLSVDDKKHVSFSCEEGYLSKGLTRSVFLEKVDELAQNSCDGDFTLKNPKLKTLTINPGEYYSKASVGFRCDGHLKPNVNFNAEEVCRYLLGSSYRSLSARKNNAH